MKRIIFILAVIFLASCSDDDFNPIDVTMDAYIERNDNNIEFVSNVTNHSESTEVADIRVWYHAQDVYFEHTFEGVTLSPGTTFVGTTLREDVIDYEISSVHVIINGVEYKVQ